MADDGERAALVRLANTRAENFSVNVVKLPDAEPESPHATIVNVIANCELTTSVNNAKAIRVLHNLCSVHRGRQFASLRFNFDGAPIISEKRVSACIFNGKVPGKDTAKKQKSKAKRRKALAAFEESANRKRRRNTDSDSDGENDDAPSHRHLASVFDIEDVEGDVDEDDVKIGKIDDEAIAAQLKSVKRAKLLGDQANHGTFSTPAYYGADNVQTIGSRSFDEFHFNNGLEKKYVSKMNINGASSPLDANLIAWSGAKLLTSHGIACSVSNFKVSNIVASCAVGFWVDPLELVKHHSLSYYDPMSIAMVKVVNLQLGVVCLVFPSGRIVISKGLFLLDIAKAAQWIYRLCTRARGKGVQPSAKELRNRYLNRHVTPSFFSHTDEARVRRNEGAALGYYENDEEAIANSVVAMVDNFSRNMATEADQRTLTQLIESVERRVPSDVEMLCQ